LFGAPFYNSIANAKPNANAIDRYS